MLALIINPYGEERLKGLLCCEALESAQVEMLGTLFNKTFFLLSGEPVERGI